MGKQMEHEMETRVPLSCFWAGVVCKEWCLLHDFFAQDHAVVAFAGFLSHMMCFASGIPQGRRFSLHAFTASMQTLRHTLDEVAATSRTCLPSFAQEALEGLWFRQTPTPGEPLTRSASLQETAECIWALLQQGQVAEARYFAIHALAAVPSLHDRVLCMELLGTEKIGPLFFVDDVVAPYPDAESVEDVLAFGLPAYEMLAKAQFNYGPQKTATMACCGAPPAKHHVDVYKLLGIEVDAQMTFAKRLDVVCATGRQVFEEFFHLVESLGLSPAAIAVETPVRIEPVVLYGSELLILAPRAEIRLNTLQASWAKSIVGARSFADARGILAVAECGWPMRLGTMMLERAIIAFARIQLMPRGHPARTLLEYAIHTPCDSWAQRVVLEMNNPRLSQPIPQVSAPGVCPDSMLAQASQDQAVRKNVLKKCKLQVVRPALVRLDSKAYALAASKSLVGLGCCFKDLAVDLGGSFLASVITGRVNWRHLRIWWMVRLTGCWPVNLYVPEKPLAKLAACPLCNAADVIVSHAWLCPAVPPGCDEFDPAWTLSLFEKTGTGQAVAARITFVGVFVHAILSRAYWGSAVEPLEDDDRIEQWMQDFVCQSGEQDE